MKKEKIKYQKTLAACPPCEACESNSDLLCMPLLARATTFTKGVVKVM